MKTKFYCKFYNLLIRDIVGVMDETLRYYSKKEFYVPMSANFFRFSIRLDLCKNFVRRPTFRNLCFLAYTIDHYIDFIPPSAFESKKVSPYALFIIHIFNQLNYGNEKDRFNQEANTDCIN